MPHLTPYHPTIKYSDVEAKLMIMIERSLDCNARYPIRPGIEGVPSQLFPEYVASMLRTMLDKQNYVRPTWDEENRQWKVGERVYKAKPSD